MTNSELMGLLKNIAVVNNQKKTIQILIGVSVLSFFTAYYFYNKYQQEKEFNKSYTNFPNKVPIKFI